MEKRMTVEPENQENELDKDGGAGEISSESLSPQVQQVTLWENSGDSLDDVSFSNFQNHSLTQTTFD